MAARSTKISRPVLYEPVARERLFVLLDALRTHSVVWIAAPPGAGKTTLVASWLEGRQAYRALVSDRCHR
jgi:ATP/maltotriose-dependent transcriptional regulator MalT